MNVSRESVSVALFNLLRQNPTLKQNVVTFTRVPKMWNDVLPTLKPMLLLFKGGPATEEYIQPQERSLALPKFTVALNLWLYLAAQYPPVTAVVETSINNIADGIDNALQSRIDASGNYLADVLKGERQNLGPDARHPLVNNTYLQGGSEWSREFQDGNCVIMWRILVDTGI